MMMWNTKKILRRISRKANPSRDFVVTLQHRLEDAGYLAPSRTRVLALRWKGLIASFGLLASLTGATATYAFNSESMVPDHPLYGLRLSVEKIELALARSPERIEFVQQKQLQRRLHEALLMGLKDKELPSNHAAQILDGLDRLGTKGENLKDDEEEKLNRGRIQQAIQLQRNELSEIIEQWHEVEDKDEKRALKKSFIDEIEEIQEDVRALEPPSKRKIKNRLDVNSDLAEVEDEE